MTPDEINKEVAEKVMGIQYPEVIIRNSKYHVHRMGFPHYVKYYEEFDPYHRIDHALMALEKAGRDRWTLNHVCGWYMLWQTNVLGKWADTATAAICMALLEAVEEKP